MILIADSGSTKTTWTLLGKEGIADTYLTPGINPFFLDEEEIVLLLKKHFLREGISVDEIHFYGAGCIPVKTPVVAGALNRFFNAGAVYVESDLLGAAHSLGKSKECIVSILGTGSNSCYYNGRSIEYNVSPLGYVLGDEGSGAVLGKKLVGDVLKDQLSASIKEDFFLSYNQTKESVLDSVYKKPFPNRFLASFTPFILKYIDNERMKTMVENSFEEFLTRNVFQYKNYDKLPLHFTGSIAYYFKNNLINVIEQQGLRVGDISKDPMDGLVEYHKKRMAND